MKQELKQIYDDLSSGQISQKRALEKIKAIKQSEQGKRTGALLATPVWQASAIEASAAPSHDGYAECHVVLCERSTDVEQLRRLLPDRQCLSLLPGPQQSIAQRYSDHALACFERIQTILQGRPQGKVLVQI